MTREDVKVMIGDFREIENEELLEKIIESYEDDDASYKEAYLILQKDKNISGYINEYFFAVLDYGTSFTVIDEYGDAQTYDEDDVSERYNEIEWQKFYDYFDDYFEESLYDGKFNTIFKPLNRDIYLTICEYGLDEEKFLRCFMKNNGKVDYDIVDNYYQCLKYEYASVSDFVDYYYKSNL